MAVDVHTLLCPVDLSDYSEEVLAWARTVAERSGAVPVVFHALAESRERMSPPAPKPDPACRFARAGERINKAMAGWGHPWQMRVEQGNPVDLAAGLARESGAGLMISASRGLSGVRRMVLGSVVERMVREISLPFLVLRPRSREFPRGMAGDGVPRIPVCPSVVAATDLSPSSLRVVETARFFARILGAALFVVHAAASPAAAEEGPIDDAYGALQERLQESLRQRILAQLPCGRTGDAGYRTEAVLLTGNPAEEILRFIRDKGAGMAAVGVRHRTVLGKLLFGSTTETLIRRAPCHVLAVPETPPARGQSGEEGSHA